MNRSCWPNSISWQRYWPSGIIAFIATIQLLISFVIVGIQCAVVVIGIATLCMGVTPRYVMGFVCWGFFLACWISTFCVTCCNRSSAICATYVLVKNILAFIFSAVLIDFDRKFITNPFFDYNYNGDPTLCNYNTLYYNNNNNNNNGNVDLLSISVSLTKGQLAGAVIILVTSLCYVGIYVYVYIRAFGHDGRISTGQFSAGGPHPSHVIAQPKTVPPIVYNPQPIHSHNNAPTVNCPNCGTTVYMTEYF